MPEGAEIDTDKLSESIQEELEKEGGSFLRKIALTTALIAVLAAVSALQAGGTINEALLRKTDAARMQSEASDQWAFYQAKGIKAGANEAGQQSWLAAGKPVPDTLAAEKTRYQQEQEGIRDKAKEKEKERDALNEEAEHLLHRHHRFAGAVALFQIAIALGAIAALTKNRMVWMGSLAVGLIGTTLFVIAFIR